MATEYYIMPDGSFPVQGVNDEPVLITRAEFEACCCEEPAPDTCPCENWPEEDPNNPGYANPDGFPCPDEDGLLYEYSATNDLASARDGEIYYWEIYSVDLITEYRWKEGFLRATTVSCTWECMLESRVLLWDGSKWTIQSDWAYYDTRQLTLNTTVPAWEMGQAQRDTGDTPEGRYFHESGTIVMDDGVTRSTYKQDSTAEPAP